MFKTTMTRMLQTHLPGAIDYTSATFLELLLSSALGIYSGEVEGKEHGNTSSRLLRPHLRLR